MVLQYDELGWLALRFSAYAVVHFTLLHNSPCIMPKNHYEPPQNDSLIDMLLSLPRHLRTLFGHPTEEDKAENLKEYIKKELDKHIFK